MPEASVHGCIYGVSAKASPNRCLPGPVNYRPRRKTVPSPNAVCPHPNPLPQAGEGIVSRCRLRPWSRPASGRGDCFALPPPSVESSRKRERGLFRAAASVRGVVPQAGAGIVSRCRLRPWSRPASGRGDCFALPPPSVESSRKRERGLFRAAASVRGVVPQAGEGIVSRCRLRPWSRPASGRGDCFALPPPSVESSRKRKRELFRAAASVRGVVPQAGAGIIRL